MANQKKRKDYPIADNKTIKKRKQQQLNLHCFYEDSVIRDSVKTKAPKKEAKKKRTSKSTNQPTLHTHYMYDIPWKNRWYIQHALANLLYVLESVYQNHIRFKNSPLYEEKPSEGLQSLSEYIALEKISDKIEYSKELIWTKACITSRAHPKKMESRGTQQIETIEKLVLGFIRLHLEDVYNLEMPQDVKLEILPWYGNIIMSSKILNVNHVKIIGFALNEFIPKLTHFSLYETYKFQDIRHDIRFIVVIESNVGDILVFFSGGKKDKSFSLFLQTSIETTPVKYTRKSIYHLPNDYMLDTNRKFTEIFIDWFESDGGHDSYQPDWHVDGIGSLLTHNLMKPQHKAITCAQFEVFLFK